MAILSIRKLDDQVYKRLRLLAAEHGVSIEEEARQIITKAVVMPAEHLDDLFEKYFGRKNGVDLDAYLEEHRNPHNPLDL